MSTGTFGYPLCFTAMLVAIGLMVIPPAETCVSGKSRPVRGAATGQGVAPGPVVMGPAGWNRLFNEAEQAFTAKNYDIAILKLRELLGVLGDNRNAPLEMLCFNIGLASLMNDKNPDAEAAFSECIKRFPKGEYTSRAYLGLGRARMLQANPQVKISAIDSLKIAANDPRYYAEAILWIGEVYSDFGKHDEALAVYHNFIGSEVRTMQQATAAVAVVGIFADQGRLDELEAQLGSFVRQTGVRDSIAWFANQMIIRGDDLAAGRDYQSALAFYRFVPSRDELLEIQRGNLEKMRRRLASLESRVRAEANMPIARRSIAPHFIANLKSTIEQAETMLIAVDEKTDMDAMLLMRRGRCLLRLNRYEEALVCFRTICEQYPDAADAEKAAHAEIVTYGEIFTRSHLGNRSSVKLFSDEFLWQQGID